MDGIKRTLLENGVVGALPSASTCSWMRRVENEEYSPAGMTYTESENFHDYPTVNSFESDYRSTQGWDIPNFNKHRNEGELLPMTRFEQKRIHGAISGRFDLRFTNIDENHVHNNQYHNHWSRHVKCDRTFVPPDFASLHLGGAEDLLELESIADSLSADAQVQAAAAKIYSSGFDALTSGAEFHKTVKMFLSVKKKLMKMVSLKHELIKQFKSGQFVDSYLQGRYGWRILVYELIELHQAVTAFSEKREIYTDFAFGGRTDSSSTTDSFWRNVTLPTGAQSVLLGSYVPLYKLRVEEDVRISLKGTVTAYIKPDQFSMDGSITAWELVPYSFVVDWFINIGTWLSSLQFQSDATDFVAAEGFQVTKTKKFSVIDNGINLAPSVIDEERPGLSLNGEVTYIYTQRLPTDSIPILPRFNLKLNVFKIADLYALLYSSQRR